LGEVVFLAPRPETAELEALVPREELAATLKLVPGVPVAHLPLLVLQLFTQVAVVAVLPWVDLAAQVVAVAEKLIP
jgi:hypothetical protein